MSTVRHSEKKSREETKSQVKAKRNFFKHLAVYVGIVLLVVIIWATTGIGSTWCIWPLLAWGIGIFAYYLALFVFPHGMTSANKFFHEQPEWAKRRAELIKKEAERRKKQVEKRIIDLNKSRTSDGEE